MKDDPNFVTNMPKYLVQALWVICLFIYFYFTINVHMHESYVYAGSLEGFFDITHGHLGVSPWLKEYNPFGIYHPNHPLLHLLAFLVKKGFALVNLQLTALELVTAINTLTGFFGGLFFYRILMLFTKDKIFATLMSLVLLFSDMYWFLSKSGEAYVSGQCFNILSTYYVFKYLREQKVKYIFYQAISLAISISFHSLFVFMLIPQLFLFYSLHKIEKTKKFLQISSIVFFTILFFGIIFYILPLYYHVGAKSLGEMIKIFLMYGEEMGVWTQEINDTWQFFSQIIVIPFFSGILHFSYGLLDGVSTVSLFLRAVLIILIFWVLVKSFKVKKLENQYMIIWFMQYFLFTCYILFLPYDMTYWIFLLPPFIFMLFYQLKDSKINRYLPRLLVLIFFFNNFAFDIYPKYRVEKEDYFQVKQIGKEIGDVENLGVLIFDSYAETSYLNYYGIIWSLKNDPMLKNKKIEIIIDNNELSRKIDFLSRENKSFYILSNNTVHEPSLKELHDKLSAINYKKTRATNFRHFYNPILDKTSEFQHEESWFDLGPIGKSWVMNLDFYEKI